MSKSKKTLKIKQLVKRYTLCEVVEEQNTVTYSTEIEGNELPRYVGFSVARKKEGDEGYTGASVLSGSIYNGSFNLSTPVTDMNDFILMQHIHTTGNGILNGEIEFSHEDNV